MQMHSLIFLSFGTLQECIAAQSHTKFGANLVVIELWMIICIKADLLSRLQGKLLMGIT